MIDRLQRIAQRLQILRLPSLVVGALSLVAIAAILLLSASREHDRFVIPSLVALLWSISTYSFVVTFRAVPQRADRTLKGFGRLLRAFARAWFWFVGVAFLGATLAVVVVTLRMTSLWLKAYGG